MTTTAAPTSQNDPRAQKGAATAKKNNSVLPKAGDEGTAQWFATELLKRIGAPTSSTNVQAMVSWMAAEGGNWNNSAKYNPLNTTLAMQGDAGTMNSVGVRKYTSWQQGLDATANTLLGKGRYTSIIDAFKNQSNPNSIYQAITSSPWGTHKIASVSSPGSYGVTPTGGANSNGTWNTAKTDISSNDFALNFGYQAAFFDSDPSLKSVLNQAVANGWYDSALGLQHFQAALQNTTWYQKHSDAQRSWTQLVTTDGKTAQRQVDAKYADLKASAVSMGVNVSDARLRQMATDSLKFGLTQQEDTIALGHEFKYTKQWQAAGGVASQLNDQFSKSAYDYGVNINDKDKFDWVQDVLMGTKTSDAYLEHLKTQVKASYPGMSKMLDSGMTTRQIASPYLGAMQNILEIDPNSVDLTKDTTLRKAFSYKPASASGKADTAQSLDPGLMPTWQFEQTLRQDPRWMQTDNAQKSFMDTGVSVLRSMGLVS